MFKGGKNERKKMDMIIAFSFFQVPTPNLSIMLKILLKDYA
jgi:hypothetical protein